MINVYFDIVVAVIDSHMLNVLDFFFNLTRREAAAWQVSTIPHLAFMGKIESTTSRVSELRLYKLKIPVFRLFLLL